MDERLKKLLLLTAEKGASDLHIVPTRFPTIRIEGDLVPLTQEEIISQQDAEKILLSVLDDHKRESLGRIKDVDLAFSIGNDLRFRANIYVQHNGLAGSFRVIQSKIETIEELNLPPVLHQFAERRQGLVLLTGPAGTGKTTTLASLIDDINHSRASHVITVEEPIEYVFLPDKALISQREVPVHAPSWTRALVAALREDPDVIMIGELRDSESISIALTAAETGHLVLGTMHTNSASQTIDRILDILPENQKNQARFQMASTLIGIISQRLVPRVKGGRIPACEVLIADQAIRNLIRENKVYQIDLAIETGLEKGMITLERSLATLVNLGEISDETAISFAPNLDRLRNVIS